MARGGKLLSHFCPVSRDGVSVGDRHLHCCTLRLSPWLRGGGKGSGVTTTTQSPAEALPSVSFHKLTVCLKLEQQQHYFSSCCANPPCCQAWCCSPWGCGAGVGWQVNQLLPRASSPAHEQQQTLLIHCRTCKWKVCLYQGDVGMCICTKI